MQKYKEAQNHNTGFMVKGNYVRKKRPSSSVLGRVLEWEQAVRLDAFTSALLFQIHLPPYEKSYLPFWCGKTVRQDMGSVVWNAEL